jgi:hypothetical protein
MTQMSEVFLLIAKKPCVRIQFKWLWKQQNYRDIKLIKDEGRCSSWHTKEYDGTHLYGTGKENMPVAIWRTHTVVHYKELLYAKINSRIECRLWQMLRNLTPLQMPSIKSNWLQQCSKQVNDKGIYEKNAQMLCFTWYVCFSHKDMCQKLQKCLTSIHRLNK